MSQDPFAPPRADLEVPEEVRGPPPRRVKIAVALATVGFVLGLAMSVAVFLGAWSVLGQEQGDSPLLIVSVSMFALYCVLVWRIYIGQNWARILLVVLAAIGFYGLLSSLALVTIWLKGLSLLYWVLGVVKVIIETVAVVALFTGESKAWFRS